MHVPGLNPQVSSTLVQGMMHAVSHAHSIFPQGQVVLRGGLFSSFSLKRTLGRFAVSAVQLRLFINLFNFCAQIIVSGVP